MNRLCVVLAVASVTGCASLVSDPCDQGYRLENGACVANSELGSGSGSTFDPPVGPDTVVVAPIDPVRPLACELPSLKCDGVCIDVTSDPENCGHCGRECESGICTAGRCVGDLPGHIIAIGHDYGTADPAMDRVLANALALDGATTVRVGWWKAAATQEGAIAASHRGLSQTGRSSFDTTLTGDLVAAQLDDVDAIVIEPQVGDGDAAEAAGTRATGIASFLAAGHVVVILETVGGVSYRFATGASLFDVAAPVDVSGTAVDVTDLNDAVAEGVVSPYLARASSIGYPGVASPVVADQAGDAVVFHSTY